MSNNGNNDRELQELDDKLKNNLLIQGEIDTLREELHPEDVDDTEDDKSKVCGLADYTGLNLLKDVVTGTTNAVIGGTVYVGTELGTGIKKVSGAAVDLTTETIDVTTTATSAVVTGAIDGTMYVTKGLTNGVIDVTFKTGELIQDTGSVVIKTISKPFKPRNDRIENLIDWDDYEEAKSLTDSDIDLATSDAIVDGLRNLNRDNKGDSRMIPDVAEFSHSESGSFSGNSDIESESESDKVNTKES